MPFSNYRLLPAVQGLRAVARPSGCWQLKRGQALSLHPLRTSELRLVQGRVWVTLGAAEAGDFFLEANDLLRVPAGARLVMEPLDPLNPLDKIDVLFDWCDAPTVERLDQVGRFRQDVLAPAAELAVALRQVVQASLRLGQGLLGYSEFMVAGRGRVLTPLEGNPP